MEFLPISSRKFSQVFVGVDVFKKTFQITYVHMEKYVTPQASYHDVKKNSQQLSYTCMHILT